MKKMSEQVNQKFNTYPRSGSLEGLPIKIVEEEYECGCWGRLHPPRIDGDTIIVEAGKGYQSNHHLHFQNFSIDDVDATSVLITVRKSGDFYGHAIKKYIAGRDDGSLFITQVPKTVETLSAAYAYLTPKAAQKPGTIRQGDIFFVPTKRKIAPEKFVDGAIRGNHHGKIAHIGNQIYATGTFTHPQHAPVTLTGVYRVAFAKNAARHPARRGGD